jgi:hypothetical protein
MRGRCVHPARPDPGRPTYAAGGRLRPGGRDLASQAAINVFGFLAIAAITVGIAGQVLAGLVLERPLLIVAALLYGLVVTSAALAVVGYTVSDSAPSRAAVVRRNVSLLGLALPGRAHRVRDAGPDRAVHLLSV